MKNRLKNVMMQSETSDKEVAEMIGIDAADLVNIVLASDNLLKYLTSDDVEKLARYFHTNPAYLVGWSDNDEPMRDREYTIQVFPNKYGFLNIDESNGTFFLSNLFQEANCQIYFTQAEIDELKQRKDLAIDWDKAAIEEVECNE